MSGGVLLCQMKAGKMTTMKVSLSLSSPVQKVLTEAASFCGAPEERIELTYQGRVLSKKDKLDLYPVADGGLIMVLEIPPQQKPEVKSVKLSPEEIRKFKTALKMSAFPKVVKRLLEKENLDNLCAACPGLSEDSLAQAFLTKPDLLTHLCDPEVMAKITEAHPCLLEAAKNLAAAVHEEKQASARSGSSAAPESEASTGGGSYYLDEMSDDEMDTEEGGQQRPQRSRSLTRGGITPAQLAQALAMASGIGQPGGGNPFQGVTGMGVSGGQEAGGHQASQPSSASARITANMFQQAMQQALLSSSGGQPQHSDTGASGGQQGGEADLAAKVERMREMGIIDEGLAIQALQIMGGDLQAAVDLIFSGWAGGDEAMS